MNPVKTLFPLSGRVLVLASALFLAACGGGGAKVEATALTAAFASAPAEIKSQVDSAARAMGSGDYEAGLKALVAVAKQPGRLSDEQGAAMTAVAEQVGRAIAERPTDNDMALHQLMEEMMAGLHGREASRVGAVGMPQ